MTTFLILVMLYSGGVFDVKMSEIGTPENCEKLRGEIVAMMPKMKGVRYHISCITLRDTNEVPV